MTAQRPSLFDPVTLGEIELPNRIVMASMSRARANNDGFVPAPIQAEYYSQRASAGLILSEGTWPSREAVGAAWVPGLFSDAQVEGWRNVTDAVHAAGGWFVAQLGHTGGASHPALLDGNLPLAPSAVSLNQPVFTGTLENSPVPQPMTADDIARTIDDSRQSTWRARERASTASSSTARLAT